MKLNRKGFTIVELVIVIAVIAILAAVLIPTFSGVVAQANSSAALQTARSTLTNALNMSSNASLQGPVNDVNKTVFVVDGYAFNYTGNALEAIDFPTSSSALKHGTGDGNNFNAILIAADNLVETDSTDALETGKLYEIKNVDKQIVANTSDNALGCTDIAAITNVTYVKDGKTAHYYLNFANTYTKTTDTALATGKTYYTQSGSGTADSPYVYAKVGTPAAGSIGSYYEITGSTYDAEIFTNTDFAKNVVVFTTFGK